MSVSVSEKIALTIKEVSGIVGLCPAQIRNMVREGKFPKPFLKTKKCVRWSRVAIETWANSTPK